ncbi:LysR family transcriptional regulator [Altererythrobacter sp.]|uniref:LysR family transcriptional regulator n=1 Tax=Altererythrobacter sp. TaxID=1872480 RepID=UPI001B2D029F|nr:LysR family transcriptional regulator [Altererythrobacter sp.]MBO6609377.1 LysR family transcriptional regulator [Altererythrobacter sp.]MBO6640622.1 LysR family transcriptional regulator [Altererythrobacter sp.]MBO6708680.1 LysR family transcriptional regulator [Altererythrobacter sp.]
MDELRTLRHFEAVFRLASFSTAADELGLTHSAITKSIKSLEAEWGAQLFHRTTRSVVATEAGKKLYPRSVELLAAAANVRASVSDGDLELNIVSGPVVIESMIHPAIVKFAQRYPKTRINVLTMPPHLGAEELLQRRIHLLIYNSASLMGLPHKDRMRETKVVDEPYWMVSRGNHPVHNRRRSLEDLARFEWALAGYDQQFETSLPEKFRKLFQESGLPRYRLLSQIACLELVKRTDTLTAVPQSAARAIAKDDHFSTMPLPENFRFSINAAVLRDAGREPSVEHFIECL